MVNQFLYDSLPQLIVKAVALYILRDAAGEQGLSVGAVKSITVVERGVH